MELACPNTLFSRDIADGRAAMRSTPTLAIGIDQGMGDIEYGKVSDVCFPPSRPRLFDGPTCAGVDSRRILRNDLLDGVP
eukprot:1118185-Alexandrium_andersonii.AAC.1